MSNRQDQKPFDPAVAGARPPAYRTLEEYAYEEIKRAVLEQRLKPGEEFTLQELENRLAISRTPIRQALRRLAQERYITLYPHAGARVNPLNAEEARELYKIRAQLEALAMAEAAAKILPEELAALEALLEEMERATVEGDTQAILKLNHEFHVQSIAPCRMPRLQSLITELRQLCERYRWSGVAVTPRLQVALEEHRALYDALAQGDGDRAMALMIHHLAATAETIVAALNIDELA